MSDNINIVLVVQKSNDPQSVACCAVHSLLVKGRAAESSSASLKPDSCYYCHYFHKKVIRLHYM